jgi:hypothetical protein
MDEGMNFPQKLARAPLSVLDGKESGLTTHADCVKLRTVTAS